METPLITIITVVLNDEKNIEETILSVLNQKYKNIQYVIIDGESKDRTKNIVEKMEFYENIHGPKFKARPLLKKMAENKTLF